VQIPQGKGQFSGIVRSFKSIGNFRCSRHCSVAVAFAAKKHHSIVNNVKQQKGSFTMQASAYSILKISWRRRCGLLAAKGIVGLHSLGEV